MEQMEQSGAGGGNTETPPAKRDVQKNYFFFTLNNHTEIDVEHLEHTFNGLCDWYIFQEETGDEGTPHLQGTIKLKIRCRKNELFPINPRIHWEATKCVKSSKEYCSKEETRTGRQFCKGIDIPVPIRVTEPYGWQTQVMDIIKTEPDDRTIHWFWEPNGHVGKSSLVKFLVVKHRATVVAGKGADILYSLLKVSAPKIILVDIPRVNSKYVSVQALESIKNGLIVSGKYEGGTKVFNPPHVICFANTEPPMSDMSQDRWNVVEITPS